MRGRKITVAGCIKNAIKNNIGWKKYYQSQNERIKKIAKYLPKGLPAENLVVDTYTLVWNEKEDTADKVRAEVGRLFGVVTWKREVNQYDGKVSYHQTVRLGDIGDMVLIIKNGHLAEGCKVVQVEEVRKVWKSVCPENETNPQS